MDKPSVFTVEAGRLILRNGERYITILRRASISPVEADELTHRIAGFLNAEAQFKAVQQAITKDIEENIMPPMPWDGKNFS